MVGKMIARFLSGDTREMALSRSTVLVCPAPQSCGRRCQRLFGYCGSCSRYASTARDIVQQQKRVLVPRAATHHSLVEHQSEGPSL